MEMLPTLEQKTVKVESQKVDELFKTDIVSQELSLELELLARCVSNCGNDLELIKQEVFRRVHGMQDFLARMNGWK